MRKNKLFELFILLSVLIFTGCSHIFKRPSYVTYIYAKNIYAILENKKAKRINIPKNNTFKMNELFREKYGFTFGSKYNKIYASKMLNKENKEDRTQYIHFFNDIKITIGNKEYIIPKEDISEIEGYSGPFYTYPTLFDFEHSQYNDIIIDLGEIEIYDENGKIQRKRRKIPPVLIKKLYYTVRCNDFMCTSKDTLYNGWAEDYPEELKKLQGIKD